MLTESWLESRARTPQPSALARTAGGGHHFPNADRAMVNVGLGRQFRFLDNHEGDANEPGGHLDGRTGASSSRT